MYSDNDSMCVSPASSSASCDEWNFHDDLESRMQARRMGFALEHEISNMCLMNEGIGAAEISCDEGISRFYMKSASAAISMEQYIQRIRRYLTASSSIYVVAFVYMHRIRKYEPRLALSDLNSHRIFLTAVMLAVKYMEDEVNTNKFFAKLGGIATVREMNAMESEFLNVMKFDVAVSPEEYNITEAYLEAVAERV